MPVRAKAKGGTEDFHPDKIFMPLGSEVKILLIIVSFTTDDQL
jgi:hypothetical protein